MLFRSRLTKPTAGKVFFQGKDVAEMSKHEIKDMRREMQFIFQDPYASLNPRMTIGEIVSEPLTPAFPGLCSPVVARLSYTYKPLAASSGRQFNDGLA